jgi:ribonuclease BN (tRNA processing enzyme)
MQKIQLKDTLPMTTDGTLELFFIGVGSAFTKKHGQSNLLIRKGNDHVMVDFGRTGPEAFGRATKGQSDYNIEVLLPTHSHGDHVGGIEQLAQQNKYVGIPFMKRPKLKIVITQEYQRILWENTLRGGLEYNEELADGKRMMFIDYFDIIRPKWSKHEPREVFKVDVGSIHLEIFRTNHIPEQAQNWAGSFISYGLFIDNRILFSGDSKLDINLMNEYADRAEDIFHDIQFFPGAVHAPLVDVNEQWKKEWKNKTNLYHIGDNYTEFEKDIGDFRGWAEEGVIYRYE